MAESANSFLHRIKPAASGRTHVLAAALLWTVVGGALLYAGTRWVFARPLPYAAALAALAVAAGILKARLVLRRTAERTVGRIRRRGEGRCLGGFLSLRAWLFVAAMILLGQFLRSGVIARPVVGLVYIAVGIALLAACGRLWATWYRFPTP